MLKSCTTSEETKLLRKTNGVSIKVNLTRPGLVEVAIVHTQLNKV